MYCPQCGSQTLDDAKYCRGCGTDVSLVPMALTGQLASVPTPVSQDRDIQRSLARAITNSVTGVGFVVVALSVLLFAPAGHFWWFWMLIPAFALLGSGLADYARYRRMTCGSSQPQTLGSADERLRERTLSASGFTGTLPPASVTEGTTRQLGERADEMKE